MRIIVASTAAAIAVLAVGCSSSHKTDGAGLVAVQHSATATATANGPSVAAGSTQPASPTESMTPCGVTGAVCPVTTTSPASPAGWGTYRVTDPDRGTVYGITIKAGLDGAAERQVQAYRRLTGYVKPVNYVLMTIDNTKGSETAWYSDLSIVSTTGKTYKLETASDEVDAIREGLSDDSNDTEITTGNAISDAAWSGNESILPGAKSTVLFIGGPDMPRPGRVFLDGNEAHREG